MIFVFKNELKEQTETNTKVLHTEHSYNVILMIIIMTIIVITSSRLFRKPKTSQILEYFTKEDTIKGVTIKLLPATELNVHFFTSVSSNGFQHLNHSLNCFL